MIDKFRTYIGFAIKSKSIVYGVDNIESNLAKDCMVIIDKSLSDNSLNKLQNVVSKANIKIFTIDNITLDELLHTSNCKAIGLTSVNLASAIRELNLMSEVRN